jgi:hypothetical protein
LEFEIDCAPLHEPVYVDREMWAKIVLNLLSNALKFTFSGQIAIRVDSRDGFARLVVADTGIGIEPAEQARLFERFHRVLGAGGRTHEGSGIGLALVAELAELHGGRARVQSRPGAGSTFTVQVPLGDRHLPREQLHAERRDDTAIETRGGGLPRRGEPLAASGRGIHGGRRPGRRARCRLARRSPAHTRRRRQRGHA